MYFDVNFNVFLKLIKVHLLVSELNVYKNARYNNKKTLSIKFYSENVHNWWCSSVVTWKSAQWNSCSNRGRKWVSIMYIYCQMLVKIFIRTIWVSSELEQRRSCFSHEHKGSYICACSMTAWHFEHKRRLGKVLCYVSHRMPQMPSRWVWARSLGNKRWLLKINLTEFPITNAFVFWKDLGDIWKYIIELLGRKDFRY